MGGNQSHSKKNHSHSRHKHRHHTNNINTNLIEKNTNVNAVNKNVTKEFIHFQHFPGNDDSIYRHESKARPHLTMKANDNMKSNANPATTPAGYSPTQFVQAYGLNNVTGNPTGSGVIIAIVDAYGYPNAASDLSHYCTQYNLNIPNVLTDNSNINTNHNNLLSTPPSGKFNFLVHKMSSNVTNDSGWAVEQALDIQIAHAIAPKASIILIQANTSNNSDLYSAISYAKNVGASVISCSWGMADSSSSVGDTTFNSFSGAFTVSSGDSIGVEYPASNPNVLAVGGTNIVINSSNGHYVRSSETAWYNNDNSATGGGTSSYQVTGNQNALPFKFRHVPDVSMLADPNHGVAIYDTYVYLGWLEVGGTSVAAPMFAGVLALANQLRLANSKTVLTDAKLKSFLYTYTNNISNAASYFYDVTNGGSGENIATTSYDLMTGYGSPLNGTLVTALAALP